MYVFYWVEMWILVIMELKLRTSHWICLMNAVQGVLCNTDLPPLCQNGIRGMFFHQVSNQKDEYTFILKLLACLD